MKNIFNSINVIMFIQRNNIVMGQGMRSQVITSRAAQSRSNFDI